MPPTRRQARATKGDRSPALYLGVFGKHPGWDDHIDDIGLETDRLAAVKRALYADGIAGNIDSGAWEKLEDPQRLPGFAHEFVWRDPAGFVVGRLWSSRDGKGRTKYPMAVVVQTNDVPSDFVERRVIPKLEEVERRCAVTSSSAEVRQVVEEARKQLRAELLLGVAADAVVAGEEELTAADLTRLANNRELAGEGMLRILYEIDRELVSFRASRATDTRWLARSAEPRGQLLRLPACAPTTMESSRLWRALLDTQIDVSASVLAIKPQGRDWIDVIIGDPAPAHLFCVRASEKGLALASQVPYTLDEAFVSRATATIDAWKRGELEAPGESQPASRSGSRTIPLAASTTPASESSRTHSRPKWLRWFLPMILVAAGVTIAAMLYTREEPGAPPADKGSSAPPVRTDANARTPPSQAPSTEDPKLVAQKAEASRLAAQRAADEKAASDKVAAEKAAREDEAKKLVESEAAAKKGEETAKTAQKPADPELEARREKVVRAASEISALLAAGYGVDEHPAGGGPTVAERVAALSAMPEFQSVASETIEIKELPDRVAGLKAIAATSDAEVLLKQAGSGRAAEAVAAWSKLASLDSWPATQTQLNQAMIGFAAADGAAKTTGERAAMLHAKVEDQARAVWHSYMSHAKTEDAMVLGFAGMQSWGVSDSHLRPAELADKLLLSLKREAARNKEKPEAIKAALDSFVTAGAASPAAGVAAPVLEKAKTLANALSGGAGKDGPAKAGPASKGWGEASAPDGQSIEFVWPAQGTPKQRLEFVRVPTSAGPAYVSATEVSVGLFVDMVDAAGRWPDAMMLLQGFSAGTDQRRGPHCWSWVVQGGSPQKIQVSAVSQNDSSNGWLNLPPVLRGTAYYVKDSTPPGPTALSPMQHVSPSVAVFMARLLGCRLPTTAEWRAACDAESPAAVPNRRDATWKRQLEFVKKIDVGKKPVYPDEGAYWPPDVRTKARTNQAETAVDTDDRTLWFAEVSGDGKGRFRHLIGNVSEIVCDDPALIEGIDDPTKDAVQRAVGRAEAFRIIGASALSPREVDPAKPYPAEATGTCSDIGFRLAFSAQGGGMSAAAALAEIQAMPFLPITR